MSTQSIRSNLQVPQQENSYYRIRIAISLIGVLAMSLTLGFVCGMAAGLIAGGSSTLTFLAIFAIERCAPKKNLPSVQEHSDSHDLDDVVSSSSSIPLGTGSSSLNAFSTSSVSASSTGSSSLRAFSSSSISSLSISTGSSSSSKSSSQKEIKIPGCVSKYVLLPSKSRVGDSDIVMFDGAQNVTLVPAQKSGSPWGFYAIGNRGEIFLWNRDTNKTYWYEEVKGSGLISEDELQNLISQSECEGYRITIGQYNHSKTVIKSRFCYYSPIPLFDDNDSPVCRFIDKDHAHLTPLSLSIYLTALAKRYAVSSDISTTNPSSSSHSALGSSSLTSSSSSISTPSSYSALGSSSLPSRSSSLSSPSSHSALSSSSLTSSSSSIGTPSSHSALGSLSLPSRSSSLSSPSSHSALSSSSLTSSSSSLSSPSSHSALSSSSLTSSSSSIGTPSSHSALGSSSLPSRSSSLSSSSSHSALSSSSLTSSSSSISPSPSQGINITVPMGQACILVPSKTIVGDLDIMMKYEDRHVTVVPAQVKGSPWGFYAIGNRNGLLLWNRDLNKVYSYLTPQLLHLITLEELKNLMAQAECNGFSLAFGETKHFAQIRTWFCCRYPKPFDDYGLGRFLNKDANQLSTLVSQDYLNALAQRRGLE